MANTKKRYVFQETLTTLTWAAGAKAEALANKRERIADFIMLDCSVSTDRSVAAAVVVGLPRAPKANLRQLNMTFLPIQHLQRYV
jgi:hypothetical protein